MFDWKQRQWIYSSCAPATSVFLSLHPKSLNIYLAYFHNLLHISFSCNRPIGIHRGLFVMFTEEKKEKFFSFKIILRFN